MAEISFSTRKIVEQERELWEVNGFFSHGVVRLRTGVIDDKAKTAFSRGHCHSLAVAIWELTGANLVGVWDNGECWHVLNELEDGRYLDIEGLHTEDELLGEFADGAWIASLDYWDLEQWVDRGEYRAWRTDDAMSFARTVLAENGIEIGDERELAIAA